MSDVTYTIRRVETPDWDAVERLTLAHTGWLPECPISAWAQACHDGENLYIRMEAEESTIRATLTGQLDQVCNDSCLEFFLAVAEDDPRYFNFEVNPLGTLYLGFGGARPARVRQIPKKTEELFRIQPFTTEKGWGVTYRVPAGFLRLYYPDFTLTGAAAGNFYKCGDETVVPHYLAWAPLTSDAPDYHRRQDFGRLLLE